MSRKLPQIEGFLRPQFNYYYQYTKHRKENSEKANSASTIAKEMLVSELKCIC